MESLLCCVQPPAASAVGKVRRFTSHLPAEQQHPISADCVGACSLQIIACHSLELAHAKAC